MIVVYEYKLHGGCIFIKCDLCTNECVYVLMDAYALHQFNISER